MVTDCSVSVSRGRDLPAILALPDADGLRPGVVVVHDLMGLTWDTRRHCRRFAEAGYAALAPDLYGGGSPGCVVGTLLSSLRGRGAGYTAIAAARRQLAQHPRVRADRIGVIGFCMGGGFALLSAARDRYAVAAPFYGAVPTRAEALEGICPVIAGFGGRDRVFRGARRLSRHLDALGVPHEVMLHEAAGHSFMNDHRSPLFAMGRYTPMRAAYDAEAEAESWARVLSFFERHLGARESSENRSR